MEGWLVLFYQYAMPSLIAIVAFAILALARSFLKKYGARLDVETKLASQDFINNIVVQGVALAEQWAKNMETEYKEKPVSNDKLLKAAQYIIEELRKKGITDIAEQEIKNRIESYLGLVTLNINALPETSELFGLMEDDENEDIFPGK
jgi:hypothetical protein